MLFNMKKLDNAVFSSAAISAFKMQRCSNAESTRLPPMSVGFKYRRRRVDVLVLYFALRGFSLLTPVFLSSSKTVLNSNVTRNGSEESLRGFASSRSLFISIFIYLFIYFYFCTSLCQSQSYWSRQHLLNPFLSFLITEHMKVLLKDRCKTKPLMCCIE